MNITWISNSDVFESLSLFVKLFDCDPTKPDKSVDATATKLVSFLRNELYLEKFESRITTTADYAIMRTLAKELNKLGWHNLENKLTVCGSHDGVNSFKNGNKKMWMNIENGDWKGN